MAYIQTRENHTVNDAKKKMSKIDVTSQYTGISDIFFSPKIVLEMRHLIYFF